MLEQVSVDPRIREAAEGDDTAEVLDASQALPFRAWLRRARNREEKLHRLIVLAEALANEHALGREGHFFPEQVELLDGRLLFTPRAEGDAPGPGDAPERLEGRHCDARTDQYAFCALVVEAFSDLPFQRKHLHLVPARWRPLIRRGLSADAWKRHRSLEALAALLDDAFVSRSHWTLPAAMLLAGAAAGALLYSVVAPARVVSVPARAETVQRAAPVLEPVAPAAKEPVTVTAEPVPEPLPLLPTMVVAEELLSLEVGQGSMLETSPGDVVTVGDDTVVELRSTQAGVVIHAHGVGFTEVHVRSGSVVKPVGVAVAAPKGLPAGPEVLRYWELPADGVELELGSGAKVQIDDVTHVAVDKPEVVTVRRRDDVVELSAKGVGTAQLAIWRGSGEVESLAVKVEKAVPKWQGPLPKKLTLVPEEPLRLDLPGMVKLVVADSSVLDGYAVNDQQVELVGIVEGTTQLRWWDSKGRPNVIEVDVRAKKK